MGVLLLLGALHKASAAVIHMRSWRKREGFRGGNVVRDLDLDLGSLSARRLRVVSRVAEDSLR